MTTIIHDLGPLGATTATRLVTIPGDAYPDMEHGDNGYPVVVIRDRRGDVLMVLELGDADPVDQHQTALGLASAFEEAAERFAALEVEAGGR